jgi:hypothetical protein
MTTIQNNIIEIKDENKITINNIDNYRLQFIDGNLILERIIPFIDEETLLNKDLRNSNIKECKINGISNNSNKYNKLLLFLYSDMEKESLLNHTILNIREEEINERGYKYYENLELSIQRADAKTTLKEIINISKIKKCKIELKIRLNNDEDIYFILKND